MAHGTQSDQDDVRVDGRLVMVGGKALPEPDWRPAELVTDEGPMDELKPGDEVIRVGGGAFRHLGTVGTVKAVKGDRVQVLWHTRTHPRSSDSLLGKTTWIGRDALRRYPETE